MHVESDLRNEPINGNHVCIHVLTSRECMLNLTYATSQLMATTYVYMYLHPFISVSLSHKCTCTRITSFISVSLSHKCTCTRITSFIFNGNSWKLWMSMTRLLLRQLKDVDEIWVKRYNMLLNKWSNQTFVAKWLPNVLYSHIQVLI
jgi:hypothetical protein